MVSRKENRGPRLPKEVCATPHFLPSMPENRIDYTVMASVGDNEALSRSAAQLGMEKIQLKRILDAHYKNMILCITEGYVCSIPNLSFFHAKIRKPREGVRGVLQNGFERIEQWTLILYALPSYVTRKILRKNAKYIREKHGYEALFNAYPNKLLERNYFHDCIDRPKGKRRASVQDTVGPIQEDNSES